MLRVMPTPDAWSRFAALHGLTPDPGDPWAWVGVALGVRVRLEVVPTSPSRRRVRFAFGIGRPGLVLLAQAHALSMTEEAATGDPDFDDAVHLRVSDPVDLGCLTADVRHLATALVRRGVHVARGDLRLEPWGQGDDDDADDLFVRSLELARALAIPRDDAIRSFAAIAAFDPDVRVRAAYDLASRGSSVLASALAATAARTAADADGATLDRLARQLADPEVGQKAKHAVLVKLLSLFSLAQCAPIVRGLAADRATRSLALRAILRARPEVGEDAGEWLALVIECLPGTPVAPDLSRAIAHACAELGDPRALGALVALANDPEPTVFGPVVQALVRLPLDAAALHRALPPAVRRRLAAAGPSALEDEAARGLELLILVYREHQDGPVPPAVRADLMRLIGEHGDARFQDLLIAALDHTGITFEDGEVRLNAIAALGQVGDARALAALRPLTSGIFRSVHLKLAAADAVAAIQQRFADRGALSLSDDLAHAGALTITPDARR